MSFASPLAFLRRRNAPRLLTRPMQTRTLTAEENNHIWDHHTCPYCHSALLAGPEGGMCVNAFCENKACRARFNLTLLRGMPGEYTGYSPDYIYEDE